MPMMMINGKWVETPVGFNPLTQTIDPLTGQVTQNPVAPSAPSVAPAAPASAALPTSVGYQPGLAPGGDPWASRNLAAVAGNPFGYQYDPRFQQGYTPEQRYAYDTYVRQLTGTAPAPPPGTQGVIGGLASQTAQAGGDLAAMAARTREPGYGMGLPATTSPAATVPTPTSAPGVTPSPIRPPAPGTPPPSGGGLFTPPTGGGTFTPPTTQTPTGGIFGKGYQGSYQMRLPAPAAQGAALMAAPYQGSSYIPPQTPAISPMTARTPAPAVTSLTGVETIPYTSSYRPETEQRALPGGTAATTAIPGVEAYSRALPGGGGGAGTAPAIAGIPPATTGAAPYVPGWSTAQTGLMANLTGGLEALQKAAFWPNAMNWMQDLGNWYMDPAMRGPGALQSLLTGQQAFGQSPAMAAINQALTGGIPGQDIIPGLSNLLMTQENANPLSTQARDIYSQLLSGQLSPANTRGLEGFVQQMLGASPGLLEGATAAGGVTPDILNRAASFINPGAAQGMINQDLINRGAGMIGPENPNVTAFANDLLTKGLGGQFGEAFKRQFYEPQREELLGNLQQRGVLDSGERLRSERDLFQKNFMDSLMLQDLAARQQGAGISQAGRGLDIQAAQALGGLGGQNVGAARALSDIGLGAASTMGNLAGQNLNYANLLAGLQGQTAGQAMQGYQATTPLMAQLLQQGLQAGMGAEQNQLQRYMAGLQGYGQMNQDLARYLGMGLEGTLGMGRLGLEAEDAAARRFREAAQGYGGLLGQQGGLGLQAENMYIGGLIDMINAAVAQQTGQAASEATRSQANKGLIGAGVGAAASALPTILKALGLAAFSARILKTDIRHIDEDERKHSVKIINSIPLSRWKFKDHIGAPYTGKEHLGWIIDEVDPDLAQSNQLELDLHSVLGHMVATIQMLTKEIADLKARLGDD